MCAVFIMECHFNLAFALLWSMWGPTAILLICPSIRVGLKFFSI